MSSKKLMLNYILFIFHFIFIYNISLSQDFTTDTTFIDLSQGDSIKINAKIENISGPGNGNTVLKIDEKKKYFLFTIDHYYCTKMPLAEEIIHSFSYDTSSKISYKINVDTIIIESMKKWYSKGTILYTKLNLEYSYNNIAYTPLGTLVNETMYKPKMFGSKNIDPFQQSFNYWKKDFANNINNITSQISNNQEPQLYNLKNSNYNYKTNLYTGTLVHLGLNSLLIDAEIVFSKPETNKKFLRHSNIMRYRQGDKFKSLEFTIMNENINYRINSKYIAQLRSGLFIGINNWQYLKEEDHPIYDLVILDFSASQLFMYNPFDNNSIVTGIGITESAYYIYTKNIKFDPFVCCYLGIKF